MNNLKKIVFALSFIFILASCTEDEQVNTDCFTCDTTQTEYCYTIGNTYYHTSSSNNSFNTQLNGATWSDTKSYLESLCNSTLPIEDCYTCVDSNTKYCFTEGNTYYTVSINDTTPTEILLNGISWEDLKTVFEENCDDSDNQVSSDIIGVWNMIDFKATVITLKTPIGTTNTTTLTAYYEGYNLEYIATFTEAPNQVQYSGSYSYDITGDSEWVTGATVAGDAIYEWSIDNTNLEINIDSYDEYTTTILELTETTLKLKIETLRNYKSDGYTYQTNREIYETYEK